jgi:hypothetical protein
MAMDGADHNLLSGSRFASDEHCGVAICDEADRLLHRTHRSALSDQFVIIAGRGRQSFTAPREA